MPRARLFHAFRRISLVAMIALVAPNVGAECVAKPTAVPKIYDPLNWAKGGYITAANGFVTKQCTFQMLLVKGAAIEAINIRPHMTPAELGACFKNTQQGKVGVSKIVRRLASLADLQGFKKGAGIKESGNNPSVPYAVAGIVVRRAFELIVDNPAVMIGMAAMEIVAVIADGSCTAQNMDRLHGDLETLIDIGGRLVYTENLTRTSPDTHGGWLFQRAVTYQIDIGDVANNTWKTKIVPLYTYAAPVELLQ